MILERIREVSPEARGNNYDSRGSSCYFMGFMHSYARFRWRFLGISPREPMDDFLGRIMVMNHGIFSQDKFSLHGIS